jgi:hypothetical protein
MAAVVATALLLSGCALLPHDSGPSRDAGGHITDTVKVGVTELVAGDCFSFQGNDRGAKPVTATPCAKPHDSRIIQLGAATPAQIAKDGSLQNFMSVACKKAFETFATTVKSGTTPELQFLVYTPNTSESKDSKAKKDTKQHFSCISTDPTVSAAKG